MKLATTQSQERHPAAAQDRAWEQRVVRAAQDVTADADELGCDRRWRAGSKRARRRDALARATTPDAASHIDYFAQD